MESASLRVIVHGPWVDPSPCGLCGVLPAVALVTSPVQPLALWFECGC